MRLAGKTAIVVGAGQAPGATIGNGRATCLVFAREGAKVLCVDRDIASAEETAAQVRDAGDLALAFEADVGQKAQMAAMVARCVSEWGRVDILHYNVGIGTAGGDAGVMEVTEEAFDRIMTVNLRGCVMACKHALPIMREQGSGAIVNVSSLAAIEKNPLVAYKASKAAMVAYTEQLAIQNASYGIRANAILPGLMDTPMAVDTRARILGTTREQLENTRNARVPLSNRMGTAWDVANAALFLASDDAAFVTGTALRVDGGAGVNVG